VYEITRQPSLAERDGLVAGTLADLVAVRTKGWQKQRTTNSLVTIHRGRPQRLRE